MELNNIILCVEDNGDICELLTFHFQDAGYKVTSAKHPEEGIRLALRNNYAAIITDFYFRGMDGIDLCRVIRTFNKTTPIIFFTGESNADKKQQALEAGAQAYTIKPADFNQLTRTVLSLITNNAKTAAK